MASFLSTLLFLSLGGSVMGLFLMLLRLIMGKKLSHTFYYYAWLLVLLRFALPIPGVIPGAKVTVLPSEYSVESPEYIQAIQSSTDSAKTVYEAPNHAAGESLPQESAQTVSQAKPSQQTEEKSYSSLRRPSMATAKAFFRSESLWFRLWLLGAVFFASRYVLAYCRFSLALRKTFREPSDRDIELYSSIPFYGKPSMYRSAHVSSPMLLGLFRPVLLMPSAEYPEEIMEKVLLHELSHYKRKDIVYKWIVALVFSAHWFNPLTILFRREIDRCCELCCDERLMRGMDKADRQQYGEALLALAARSLVPKTVLVGTFTTDKRNLKERLEHIMKFKARKKYISFLTVLALILLCGCAAVLGPAAKEEASQPPVQIQVPTPMPAQTVSEPTAAPIEEQGSREIVGGEVRVSNIDEFLAAISSDTTIILEPGTYNLSDAENYGHSIIGGWYNWNAAYDGYELVIKEVSNLKITAESPEDTVISAAPRYANVLYFTGCSSIELSGFTAGHTEEPGVCRGGVIKLTDSSDFTVNNCYLYGCGIIGIDAENSNNVTLTGSRIYDCSLHAVKFSSCRYVLMDDCEIYLCGSKQPADSIFAYTGSKYIAAVNCKVYDNYCSTLIASHSSSNVSFMGTAFYENDAAQAIVASNYSPIISDCGFVNNNFSLWYAEENEFSAKAVDASGHELSGEMLEAMHRMKASFPGFETAAADGEMIYAEASTMEELLAAIAPNTTVYLAEGTYDVAPGESSSATEYYHWEDAFDGAQLVIKDVENFHIIGSGKGKTIISAAPRYADVLRFVNCDNISLKDFTAGHTEEPGSCAGDVLEFQFCEGVVVESCGLYGCGVTGVRAENSSDIEVKYTEIYDCSWAPAYLWNVENAAFIKCDIHDCGSDTFHIIDSSNITQTQ